MIVYEGDYGIIWHFAGDTWKRRPASRGRSGMASLDAPAGTSGYDIC
jgi:hypothetical protein